MSPRSHRLAVAVVVSVGLLIGTVPGIGAPPVAGAAGAPTARSADEWDTRLVDLVAEVEDLRGLEFDRPVPVKVLDSATFDRRYASEQKPTRKATKDWAETQAALAALGLLRDPVDLETLRSDVGQQVLGFYDPKRAAIVVRGDDLDRAATRATLAHELTHALQDQEFGLERIRARERKAGSGSATALIEGDASRIGQLHEESLSPTEQAEIAASNEATVDSAPDLPTFLSVALASQYSLGLAMALVLEAGGGNRAVDAALRAPPFNDLAIVDPRTLVDRTAAKSVPAPRLAAGDTPLGDATTMGAWLLYFVLASRLPPAEALRIAERWGGDSAVAFTRAGAQCMTAVMVGRDRRDDVATLAEGLRRWDTAAGARATIDERDNQVQLTSCAPSTPLDVSEAALTQAFFHLFLRNTLAAGGVQGGQTASTATCFADGIMALAPVQGAIASLQEIADEPPPGFQTTIQTAVQANAARLRSQCQDST